MTSPLPHANGIRAISTTRVVKSLASVISIDTALAPYMDCIESVELEDCEIVAIICDGLKCTHADYHKINSLGLVYEIIVAWRNDIHASYLFGNQINPAYGATKDS